jgi:Kef-type K+ transport system membrane component KefB
MAMLLACRRGFWDVELTLARFGCGPGLAGRPAVLALFGAVVLLCAAFGEPAYASGGAIPPLVHDIGIGLFLSGFLAVLFTRLKFPVVAGFILSGVLAGPLGIGLVTDPANIDTIAQLGFVLLLFVIGLEMDISKLTKSGKTIAITGLFQFPLIVCFGFVSATILKLLIFGNILGPGLAPLYIGLIISCSSTLLVVKLFQENFELDTMPGRVALGLLVFEDVWAIVVILLQPNFASPNVLPIIASFAGIAILGGLAFLGARTLIPLAFRWVAKAPEVILVGAISWCFAVVFTGANFDTITETLFHVHPGLNVSSGMGALIAGASIASLPYATEIVTKVSVVKDFFVTLFFVGLGLTITAPSTPWVLVFALVLALLAIAARQVVVFPLLYFTGLDRRNAEVTAIRLAQISEFSLVITFLAVEQKHITPDLANAIVFAFVLTSLATTPLYHMAYDIYGRVAPVLKRLGFRDPPEQGGGHEHAHRLAILGFHRVASSLLHDIARRDPELAADTLVVDFNVALHGRIRTMGAHVEYGDLSNPETLLHAGIDKARVVISTVPDDLMRGIDNRRLVESVRRLNKDAIIIANAVAFSDCAAIYAAGADYVFLSRLETAMSLNDAISSALTGTMSDYRAQRDAKIGSLSERREVLP